ncbi:MAG: hypothetical protein M3Q91_11725 [Acidobacteriota bacterium]|nr:hypothetical protein [Acidobacteriota bacterium]
MKTELATTGATPKAQFVDLPEEQLKRKAGLYRNLTTGSVWRLSVKDKKLMVEVANFSFQLAPVSTTNFLAAVGGPAKIEVIFPQDTGQSKAFTAKVEGQDPATLQAIEPVSLTNAETAEYAGEYVSDELQVTYKFAAEEGKLVIKNKGTPKLSLAPLDKDKFDVSTSGTTITFVRDSQNRVAGFKLDAGRVTGIHFAKKI